MKAVFRFDHDGEQWWIDAGEDDDHDPTFGSFVADVDDAAFTDMTEALRRHCDLRDQLVAVAGLDPDSPTRTVICPTFTLAEHLTEDRTADEPFQEAIKHARRTARCTTCGHHRLAHEMADDHQAGHE